MATLKNTTIDTTGAIQLPVGTTAQRPTGVAGQMRFNSSFKTVETYDGSLWKYMPDIVRSGLVLHLDAGEPVSYPGSGTSWNDLSGRGNNGTLVNGVGYSGDNGGSLVFDGVNDFVEVSHNTILNPSLNMTLSAWIRITSFTANMSIFGKWTTTSGSGGFDFRIENSSQLNLVKIFRADQRVTIPTLTTSTWYNICAVQGAAKVDYYIDGTNVGSFSNSLTYQTNTASLRIARSRDNVYTPASIPNILYYNRALTALEIQQNYLALKGRFS